VVPSKICETVTPHVKPAPLSPCSLTLTYFGQMRIVAAAGLLHVPLQPGSSVRRCRPARRTQPLSGPPLPSPVSTHRRARRLPPQPSSTMARPPTTTSALPDTALLNVATATRLPDTVRFKVTRPVALCFASY
jgi:hypothetical protein